MKKIIKNLKYIKLGFIFITLLLCLIDSYKLVALFTFMYLLSNFLNKYIISKREILLNLILDKCYVCLLVLSLTLKNGSMFFILLMEILIILLNVYYFYQKNSYEATKLGLFKKYALYMTIIIGFISNSVIYNGLVSVTNNLEFLTLVIYIKIYYEKLTKKVLTVDDYPEHKKIMQEDIDGTVVVNSIEELSDIYDIEKEN